jgi:hypothetical protein
MGYTVHRDTKGMGSHIFFEVDVQEGFRFDECFLSDVGARERKTADSTPQQPLTRTTSRFWRSFLTVFSMDFFPRKGRT